MKICQNCHHFIECTDAHSNMLPHGYCDVEDKWKKVDADAQSCQNYKKKLTLQEIARQEEIQELEKHVANINAKINELKQNNQSSKPKR